VLDEQITDEVKLKRMVHKYEDQHRYIKKRLMEHRSFMHNMILEYNQQLYRMNAEKPADELQRDFT
jgi:adenylate kinase family enzyme